jgi:hypothetical protein
MPLQVVGGVEKCFLRLKKICFLNKTRLLACSVSLKELCGAHSSTSKRSFPNWEGGVTMAFFGGSLLNKNKQCKQNSPILSRYFEDILKSHSSQVPKAV